MASPVSLRAPFMALQPWPGVDQGLPRAPPWRRRFAGVDRGDPAWGANLRVCWPQALTTRAGVVFITGRPEAGGSAAPGQRRHHALIWAGVGGAFARPLARATRRRANAAWRP